MPPPGPNVDVLLAATQPSCIWSLDQMTELDFHRDPSILSMVVDAISHRNLQTGVQGAGKNGRELYLHGNVRVLTDEHGAIVGAVGSFTDLTSFVIANERIAILEEQTKSRGAFLQMVGESATMQEVYPRLRLAAESDVTVLLTGE